MISSDETYREVIFVLSENLEFGDVGFCENARLRVHLPDLHKPRDGSSST